MGAQQITAGEAYVSVTCDHTSLLKGLQEVAAKIVETSKIVSAKEPDLSPNIKIDPRPAVNALREIQDATRSLKNEGEELNTVFSIGADDVFQFLKGAAMGAATLLGGIGDQFDKMSQRVGVSTEALSEYGHAASMCGGDISNIEGALRSMSSLTLNASNGVAKATATFRRLGIDVDAFQRMNPEEQFDLIASKIAAIEDPTRRAAEAMKAFGGDGQKLLPLFASGADGLKEMREEARRLGISIDESSAKMGAEFMDATERLKQSLKGVGLTIANALTPVFTDLLNEASRVVSTVTQWARENPVLSKTLLMVGGGITALIASAGVLKNVYGSLIDYLGRLKAAFIAAKTAMGGMNAAIMLTSAAFATVGVAIIAYVAQLKRAADAAAEAKTEAQEALATGNAQREGDKAELQELEALRKKQALQKLSTEEILRAVEIVADLKAKYGEVGYAVDAVTGKITAAAGAQDKLNRKMMEDKKRQLEAAIKEKQANLDSRAIDKEMADKEVSAAELALGKQRNSKAWFAHGIDKEKYGYDEDANTFDDKTYKAWMLEKDEAFQTRLKAAREKEEAEIEAMKTEMSAIADALKTPVDMSNVSNISSEDVTEGFQKTSGFIAAGVEDLRSDVEKECDKIHEEADRLVEELINLADPEGNVNWNNQRQINRFLRNNPAAQQLYNQMGEVRNSERAQVQRVLDADSQKKEKEATKKVEAMEKQIADAKYDASDPDQRAQREIDKIREQTAAYQEQLKTLLQLENAKGQNADASVIQSIQQKVDSARVDAQTREKQILADAEKEKKAKEDAQDQKIRDAMEGLVDKFGTPIEKLELAQKNLASATQALQEAQESGDKEQIAAALSRLGEAQTKYLDAQEATKAVDKSVKSLGGTFDAWQAVSLTRQASYEKKAYDESRAQTRYLAEISRKIGQAFFA